MKITPTDGKTYSDILKCIIEVEMPENEAKIGNFVQMKKGEMVIRFKGKTGVPSAAAVTLKVTVRDTGELACPPPLEFSFEQQKYYRTRGESHKGGACFKHRFESKPFQTKHKRSSIAFVILLTLGETKESSGQTLHLQNRTIRGNKEILQMP